jgi:hypothetical protein
MVLNAPTYSPGLPEGSSFKWKLASLCELSQVATAELSTHACRRATPRQFVSVVTAAVGEDGDEPLAHAARTSPVIAIARRFMAPDDTEQITRRMPSSKAAAG